jgi:hypothetical protein
MVLLFMRTRGSVLEWALGVPTKDCAERQGGGHSRYTNKSRGPLLC